MIKNACDTPLFDNSGTIPNMRDALDGWLQKLQFTLIKKSVVAFSLLETNQTYYFQGIIQPLSTQQLRMKPWGQRKWDWVSIHALPDLILNPDDIINIQGKNYRVMAQWNYQLYGFVEYHAVQDYT